MLRIRGKLDEAEAAYRQAAALGHDHSRRPTWLARGRTAAAIPAVRRLLAEAQGPVQRSWLLPAAVQVMVRHSFRTRPGNTPTSFRHCVGLRQLRAPGGRGVRGRSRRAGVRRDGGGAPPGS